MKYVAEINLAYFAVILQVDDPEPRRFASVNRVIVGTGGGEGFYCFHDSDAEEAAVFPDFRTFNNLKTLQVPQIGLPLARLRFFILMKSRT